LTHRAKPGPPREVFISHSHVDREFVGKLARVLHRRGVRTWYSEAHLLGGVQWHDEIGRALARCDWFLVVLSLASTKSRWVKWELSYALGEERYLTRIVPILLQPCRVRTLSWALPGLQQVDFTGGFARGCRDLLRIWGLGKRTGTGSAAAQTPAP